MQLKVKEHEPVTMTPLSEIPNPADTLFTGLRALEGFPPHWISCGTLLGLHRDGTFIPDDTDIDIGMKVYKGIKLDLEMPARFRPLRTLTVDGIGPMQLAFKDSEQNDCIFDIYFYYVDLKKDVLININTRTPILNKPASVFDMIEMWDSPIGPLPCPIDRDAYCKMRYGPNWRTPSNKKGIYNGQF